MSVFSVESPAMSLFRSKLVLDMSLSERISWIERSSFSAIRAIALCVISSIVDTISSSLFNCFCQRSVVPICAIVLIMSHTVSLLTCHCVPFSISSMSCDERSRFQSFNSITFALVSSLVRFPLAIYVKVKRPQNKQNNCQ